MKKSTLALVVILLVMLSACSALPKELTEKANVHAKSGGTQSREFSAKEKAEYFKAQSAYVYEGKKPDKKFTLPAKIEAENANGEKAPYFILPEDDMNENELLQLAKLSIDKKRLETAFPPQDELQFDNVKQTAQNLLIQYGFNQTDFNGIYPFYISNTSNPDFANSNNWNIIMQAKGGYDYNITIDSKPKDIKAIYRKAEGYYNGDTPTAPTPAADFTDDEVKAAAQKYYDSINLPKTDIVSVNNNIITQGEPCHAVYKQVHFNAPNENITIFVDLSDLSICGINRFPL